jgi:hypothetical protein
MPTISGAGFDTTDLLFQFLEYDQRGRDLVIEAVGAKARENFAAFRRLVHPNMLSGCWIEGGARTLAFDALPVLVVAGG